MRMSTILTSMNEGIKDFNERVWGSKEEVCGGRFQAAMLLYTNNMNCKNQCNVNEFVDFFTSKGTKMWFSPLNKYQEFIN